MFRSEAESFLWRLPCRQAAMLLLPSAGGGGKPKARSEAERQAKRAECSSSGWSCGLLFSIGKRRERTGMIRSEAERQANARRGNVR